MTKTTQESEQYGFDLNFSKTKFMMISNNAVIEKADILKNEKVKSF